MSHGTVQHHIEDHVSYVTFHHPQSNSLPGALLRKLADTIEVAGRESGSRVIVLRSEGEKAFCAGASFDELVAINDIETGKVFFSGFAAVINAMRKAPKFVIARIQGKAVGGGVGLASAADYAIAHESASVKLSELAVGIGPFVVGPAVERKIGTAAFGTLSINATEWQSAKWAMERGLYAEVHTSMEGVDEAVKNLGNKLAQSNPEAMADLKRVLWQGTDHWDQLLIERAMISGRLVLSDFTREAIGRFKGR